MAQDTPLKPESQATPQETKGPIYEYQASDHRSFSVQFNDYARLDDKAGDKKFETDFGCSLRIS
jgi:hypothetical protein